MGLGDVVAKLEGAVSELVHLKITTAVDGKELRSDIDLAQGDIRMSIDPAFLQPEMKWVLELHAAREREGAEIVRQNLAALSRLARLLPELKKLL